MAEEAKEVLFEIERLAKTMLSTHEDDRILVFRKIDPLFLKLEGDLKRFPDAKASEKLAEMKYHLIVLARLDDPDELSDRQHLEETLNAAQILLETDCFRKKHG